MQPLLDYRIASGAAVALVSLQNIETAIYPFTRPRRLPPRTSPVNLYPVRKVTISGREYGDGNVSHIWEWDVLPLTALNFIQTTYVGASAVSAAVTIYTRLHDAQTYVRYSAFIVRPVPGVDYTIRQTRAIGLQLRFTSLIAL